MAWAAKDLRETGDGANDKSFKGLEQSVYVWGEGGGRGVFTSRSVGGDAAT